MLALFLAQGVLGSLLACLLIPLRAAGRSFFRYAAGQSAVLSILALALAAFSGWSPAGLGLPLAAASVLLAAAAGLFHLNRVVAGRTLLIAAIPAALAGAIQGELSLARNGAGGVAWLLYGADAVTSGSTAGGALVAMMLGHAYLNIPGLPVRHLERLCLALLSALGLRTLVFGAALALHGGAVSPLLRLLLSPGDAAAPSDLDPFVLVGVLVHALCGLAVPAGFALMAWRSAAIGATQSATGILYVALVVILMGELASRYLLVFTGLPL